MTPFLDPADLLTVLAPLRPRLVRGLLTVTQLSRAQTAPAASRALPALIIVPERAAVSGPQGLGSGRMLAETVALLIHVQQAAADDADAYADLCAIRAAVFDLLEGRRLTADWSPFKYQGGQMLGTANGLYRWAERYSTERAIHTGRRDAAPLIPLPPLEG